MEIENIYPSTIEINTTLNKVRFFLGDRWIDVGKLEYVSLGRMLVEIKLPDVEKFILDLEDRDDGSVEWSEWGARVN